MKRTQYLITSKQHRYLFTLLSRYLQDRDLVIQYADMIKRHYNVPSTWQLTQVEAKNIAIRLTKLVEEAEVTS